VFTTLWAVVGAADQDALQYRYEIQDQYQHYQRITVKGYGILTGLHVKQRGSAQYTF